MMFGIRAALVFLVLGLVAPFGALHAETAPAPATAVGRGALEIATAKGVLVFEVELANTESQRAKGLMFRRELGERRGMLFDFKTDQLVAMWMKNTLIPLDMLFIRADGTIARIAAMTTPLSEQTISSGEPVRAVLEIDGGASRRLGIAPGDKVAHPMFPAK
ncbi:DUF192 domain-containing protein [Xanthobacter sp. KR7-225]|uniref:DUF192 domain-containing protein n=1 Tax=Xanthobacter sp. KR7-225 TaxID=3156613 RepID=UPI0032B51463